MTMSGSTFSEAREAGVDKATGVGEPGCSMDVEGDKGVQVGSGGDVPKAQLGLEEGRRRYGHRYRRGMGSAKGAHNNITGRWARPGERTGEWATPMGSLMLGKPKATAVDAGHRAARCRSKGRRELGTTKGAPGTGQQETGH
ncbi:unnamed protein product [Ilex paraguariensis]|uniref:Uncharacterized protein n=1 Tax=Ilex paraguariensis TaxID=185542 RepID=A0ABC8SEM1_9AQUA